MTVMSEVVQFVRCKTMGQYFDEFLSKKNRIFFARLWSCKSVTNVDLIASPGVLLMGAVLYIRLGQVRGIYRMAKLLPRLLLLS